MSHILLLSDRSSGWVFSMACESVEGRSVEVCVGVCACVCVCACALACDVLIGFIPRRKKGPVCQSSLSFSPSSSVKEEAARKERMRKKLVKQENAREGEGKREEREEEERKGKGGKETFTGIYI